MTMASSTLPDPQAQPPLQAVDGDTTTLFALSYPADGTTPATAAAAPDNSNHSLPTPISLASGNSSSIGADNTSESLTNFMKYGSIRPPVSVLQEEFLEKCRLWREHADPLEGIDGLKNVREHSGGNLWMGHMASVQTLFSRHHHHRTGGHLQGNFSGQSHYEGGDGLFEPRSCSLEKSRDNALCEQKCEDDEKVASDEEKADCSVDNDDVNGDECERKQLERLAALIFRPGSKLSGSIEIQHVTTRSDYELVLMEGDVMDELGQPKGALARHKFAGDEQCVFVKLSFVPVRGAEIAPEEEKQSLEDELLASQEDETTAGEDGNENSDQLGTPCEKKLTVQIDYLDGDNVIQGLWNHNALCFEGTVKKLSEGQGDSNQMGGTIISGLISGHGSFGDGSSNDESPSSGDGNISSRRQIPNVGTRTFTLSPCTHLHPRGIATAPLWLALSDNLSRLGLLSVQGADTHPNIQAVEPKDPNTQAVETKDTPENQQRLLDELASHDNFKLVLHRARTETLRRETLTKLVELGSVIDFAELARKRSIAKRREKWRGRVRKFTPRLPRRISRRGRTSTTTGGADDFDLSKDNVQKKNVHFHDQLATISWGDLLEEAAVQAEKTCAIFRRQTALLENLTFESPEYKAQIMADLRTNGLTLASSHSDWDQCIQMGRTVALGWSWFERGSWSCFERSAVVGKRCVYLLFQMHSRLESNHKHLEKAFRGADARLTNMQLERIKNGSHDVGCKNKSKDEEGAGDDDEPDGLCGVCQSDMNGEGESDNDLEDPAVCLPCGHMFHWECIREWLHNHSQCPICRVDLNAP
ncbi:hypothetical protein ACHAXR_010422 [Thalassiosira sp. AJA248-18]